MVKVAPTGLIDPRYCCCAVPLVNFGIYSIIFEQGLVSLGIGITAIAAPSVVGASFPSFASYIFAVTCFAVAICQPVGWIGVLREKTSTFKAYAWANALAITAAFSVAAALIIVSATKHNTAVSDCATDFYSPSANSTAASQFASASNETLTTQAEKICPPLVWAQVGIMGGLWLILLIVQVYFIFLTRTYSVSQVSDHKLYHSVYSENPEAFTMSVLRSSRYNPNSVYSAPGPSGLRDDAWDARPSMESLKDEHYDARQQGPSGQGVYGDAPQYYSEHGGQHDGGRYDDAYAEGSHAYPNTHEGYDRAGAYEQRYGQEYPGQPQYGGPHQYEYDQAQAHAHAQGQEHTAFPAPQYHAGRTG
ncbi:hypothetical protein DB88DRAFT_498901 [Papiliotrema laurentii]|uniref:Transmembrane protein n=1 Tax=Papiliotrema laurentii TaxID=5418 RepID=A0AAD9CT63_PAPLA|nr:hypothetical protein DB88DRAFT_498901 [Papiliotrema laurentii]